MRSHLGGRVAATLAFLLCAAPAIASAPSCPSMNLGSQVPISVQGSTILKPNHVDPDPISGLACFSAASDETFLFTAPFGG